MKISITARHFTPSNELKKLIKDRLLKLLVFDSSISQSKVVLLKVDRAEKVELIITSRKKQYITKCYSSTFEKTLSMAIKNIKNQISKSDKQRPNKNLNKEID